MCGDGTKEQILWNMDQLQHKQDVCKIKQYYPHLTVWTLSGSVSVSEEAGVAGRELELSPDTSVPVAVAYAVVRLLAELLRPPPWT